MELEPTREIATEVVKAARGDQSNRLAEVLEDMVDRGYRKIVDGVEGIANSLGSTGSRVWGLLLRKKRSAERPFAYQQAYDAPNRKQPESDQQPDVWPHIERSRPRRPERNRPSRRRS